MIMEMHTSREREYSYQDRGDVDRERPHEKKR